jgi:hypothetical protein
MHTPPCDEVRNESIGERDPSPMVTADNTLTLLKKATGIG